MSRPTGDSPPRMRGANGSTAGARGLVPRPAAADNVKYLKGDGSWSAVTNASAATNAEAAAATSTTTFVTPANAAMAVAAVRNGLAPRQGLVFDGTTSATVANLHILGTGDFTATAVIKPTSVAVGEQSLFGGSIGTFTLSIGRSIAGSLSALKVNVALAGEVSAGLVAGKWSTVTYTRSGTTGTFYVNGAAVGSTITDSQNYTVAQDGLGVANGTLRYTGLLSQPCIFNRALSAAEVLALYESGAVASADYNTAGTAFSNGTWAGTGVSAASASGFTFSHASAQYATSSLGGASAIKTGQRVRVTGTITGTITATSMIYIDSLVGTTVALTAGALSAEITAGTAVSPTGLVIYCAPGSSFTLSGLVVTRLGALLAPDANNAGAGLEWLDVSGNRAHIVLPTSGVAWSLPSSQQIVIEASTATNGNQQLGGASLIDANKQWRIQSWTVNCSTGTPTISLGNASAGAQYVSALVLAAGNNDITLLARFPSTANLWASSTTTATLIHRIVLVPAN